MGLQNTAHYLKSKGRGRDTELVHMSKREIKGLQELALAHGGSLSINPETGLVEAGFLEQILPIVAAAGLTYLTAGAAAPVLSTAMGSTLAGGIAAGAGAGALISGGTAAIQGKDVGQAALMGGLGGAISGGLGAYDGAATADLFTKGGAEVTQKTAEEAAKGVTAESVAGGMNVAPTDVSNVYSGLAGQPTVPPGTMPSNIAYPNATQAGQAAAALPEGATRNAALEALDPSRQTFTPIREGVSGIGRDLTTGTAQSLAPPVSSADAATAAKTIGSSGIVPGPTPSSYYAGLQPDQYVQKGVIQALPVATLLEDKPQQIGPQTQEESKMVGLSPNFKPYVAPQPNPYYKERYPTYAAEGGIMQSYQVGGSVDDESGMDEARGMMQGNLQKGLFGRGYAPGGMAEQKYLPKGDAGKFVDSDTSTRSLSALDAAMLRNKKLMGRSGIKMAEMPKTGIKSLGGDFSDVAAAGGVAHLGDYSDGGRLLKGPGDGVSDNIPATIGGKQPARLADGEFVVPARIVSELGNGSTEAGAKRLYAMMDRIQKARKKTIGKGKIAKDSKSSKYLPA